MIICDKKNIGYLLLFFANFGFAQSCAPTFGGSTFGSTQFGSGNLNCYGTLLPPGTPSITEVRNNGSSLTIYVNPGVGGNPSSLTATCISTDNSSNVTSSSNTSPISLLPLIIGLSYRCTVSATNSAGTSAQSSASNVVTLAAIPTLGEWAMIFMASLMAMFGIRRMRRTK
jgi:hypothetical protein